MWVKSGIVFSYGSEVSGTSWKGWIRRWSMWRAEIFRLGRHEVE